ncbi:patatin-like phospholipase family protein [Pararhodonellum marinum]|uniref:patatin-like phospholipase family protein n=1 Tax=Pararhodonellum marinum TaxID=2755358 RepID=UPI0018908F83|nr:patatin-like phospholipase family protein [Pararhodonellum marinum]
MKSRKKIGIALSGGGVRGIAHLGVLQGLNELGIFPDRVSGTSAGAIAGAMYCYGYKPKEILDIIVKTNFFKFLRPAISWTGILKMDVVEVLYNQYLPNCRFENLKVPLTIAATDIKKGKVVYFTEGELIRHLMASSCIPGMFDPILIDGDYFVDGGVLNNLPVEPLEGTCDYIIGVNSNHLPEETNIKNIKSLIERTVIMSMNYNVYSRKHKCDFFIEPIGLAHYGVFDIKKSQEIYDAGYDAVIKFASDNPKLLDLTTQETNVNQA